MTARPEIFAVDPCTKGVPDSALATGLFTSSRPTLLDVALRMRKALRQACEIIEMGDARLLASDGPAGNQPPDLTLDEWRQLYSILDMARKA